MLRHEIASMQPDLKSLTKIKTGNSFLDYKDIKRSKSIKFANSYSYNSGGCGWESSISKLLQTLPNFSKPHLNSSKPCPKFGTSKKLYTYTLMLNKMWVLFFSCNNFHIVQLQMVLGLCVNHLQSRAPSWWIIKTSLLLQHICTSSENLKLG